MTIPMDNMHQNLDHRNHQIPAKKIRHKNIIKTL